MPIKPLNPLGSAIRARRKALGITLTEAARQCGLSAQTLRRIERGTNRHPAGMTLRLIGLGLKLPALVTRAK